MHYLVNDDHKDIAAHLNRCNCKRFYSVLYIQCSGWDW